MPIDLDRASARPMARTGNSMNRGQRCLLGTLTASAARGDVHSRLKASGTRSTQRPMQLSGGWHRPLATRLPARTMHTRPACTHFLLACLRSTRSRWSKESALRFKLSTCLVLTRSVFLRWVRRPPPRQPRRRCRPESTCKSNIRRGVTDGACWSGQASLCVTRPSSLPESTPLRLKV